MTASDGARRHLIGDVVGLADRKRNDRQRRVGRSAGAELAPVRDEQVRDLVGLPPFVADSVFGPLTHPATAHVMARGEGRCLVDLLGAERFVDGTALAECVITHALVVDVIVVVDMRDGEAEPVLLGRVARDPVLGLRQILAANPHAGEARVFLDVARIRLAPSAGHHHRTEDGKPERDRLQVISASEATRGIVPRLVLDQARHLGAAGSNTPGPA